MDVPMVKLLMMVLCLVCTVSLGPGPGWLLGQEFRIETEVYGSDETQPAARNLTLFQEQMVFDFQMSNDSQPIPSEITIYDVRARTFHLVDLARNMRLTLDQAQLVQMLESARQQTRIDSKTQFLHAEMEEKMDVAGDWVDVGNEHVQYRFQGARPSDITVLPAYFDFLDQFTRLKASDPRSLPPFPRMKLNASIRKIGWIPNLIEAKICANELIREDIQMTSRHTWMGELSEQDRVRIEQARSHMLKANPVSLPEYRNLPRLADAGAGKSSK